MSTEPIDLILGWPIVAGGITWAVCIAVAAIRKARA